MPKRIAAPAGTQAAGSRRKRSEEFAGRVNSGRASVSVARMPSPEGWREPGQRPEFEGIAVVLAGVVRVEHEGGVLDVRAAQAVVGKAGEWVRDSTPEGPCASAAGCLQACSTDAGQSDPDEQLPSAGMRPLTGSDSLAFAGARGDDAQDRSRELSPESLELVARVEVLAENQDGADKSWLHRLVAWADAHHARARPR